MTAYEYRAVPAPRRGASGQGVKGGAAKFANAVTILMNEMGAEGWEYLRADTLPCEERQGLTSKTVKYHSMLVFRRALDADATSEVPPLAIEHHDEVEEDAYDEALEQTTDATHDGPDPDSDLEPDDPKRENYAAE